MPDHVVLTVDERNLLAELRADGPQSDAWLAHEHGPAALAEMERCGLIARTTLAGPLLALTPLGESFALCP